MSNTTSASLCLMDKDKILLIQRAYPPFQHHWSFVGGKLKPKETAAQAAIRELNEEMGLKAQQLVSIKTIEIKHEKNTHTLSCFKARYIGGTPRPNHEIRAFQWRTIPQALKLDLANGMQELLHALQAQL